MSEHRTRRLIFFLVTVAIGVVISACSCGDLTIQLSSQRRNAINATATAEAIRSALAAQPTSTPVPPQATATPWPTSTAVPTASSQSLSDFTLPAEPNTEFTLVVTESELNQELAGQTYDMQGLTIEDIRFTLMASEVMADLRATYSEANLSAGLTLRGAPQVIEDNLYIKVSEVTLDRSISGLMRVVAEQLIKTALEEYSTEYGIHIPIEGVDVLSVELQPQKLIIVGRTQG
ncbi:MAG: hypothetical protein JXA74_10675 [Anaerolineae bacterium]|nr:hypothetical protein [Anaerolineae bacterium]